MRRDNSGAFQEKHADAIHRMYEAAGVNPKTATESEKASPRMRLMEEVRKGGMRFPAPLMALAASCRACRWAAWA